MSDFVFIFFDWFLMGEFLKNHYAPGAPVYWIFIDRLVLVALRYAVVLTLFIAIFHGWIYRRWPWRKINPKLPDRKDYQREIKNALINGFVVNGVILTCAGYLSTLNLIEMYLDKEKYGLPYYYLSFPLIAVCFDFYFYFVHRVLHHPWLLRKIHYVHHLSDNTDPITAYSFHPVEGFLLFSYPTVFMLIFPLHSNAVNFICWWNAIIPPLGHCGFEILPRVLRRRPWNAILNCPLHHELHHRFSHKNFSMLSNLPDKLFGTNHDAYETEIEKFEERL